MGLIEIGGESSPEGAGGSSMMRIGLDTKGNGGGVRSSALFIPILLSTAGGDPIGEEEDAGWAEARKEQGSSSRTMSTRHRRDAHGLSCFLPRSLPRLRFHKMADERPCGRGLKGKR